MAKLNEMHELYEMYCSGSQPLAKILTIYIEEASDGQSVLNNYKPVSNYHAKLSDRLEAANRFVNETGWSAGEVVCDSMANEVVTRYEAHPERILIVQDGRIVHDGGKGPIVMVHYNIPG